MLSNFGYIVKQCNEIMISYPLTWKGNLKKGSRKKGRNCSTPAVASLLEIHTGKSFIYTINYSMRMRTTYIQLQSVLTHLHY